MTGNFKKSPDGTLVTSDGLPLNPNITIPQDATSVTIGTDGTVSITEAGNSNSQTLGQISLVRFINPTGLKALGGSLYQQTSASGPANEYTPGQSGTGQLKQGALEGSNVSVVQEMVAMISTQRAYDMDSKMVTATDRCYRKSVR